MSSQTHLSAKGQIVIPRDVRDRLRWTPGMRFDVIERSGSVTLVPRPETPPFVIASLDALRAFAPAAPAQAVDAISGLDDAALAALLGDD
ncbi:MAG: AbrB/MazE/SpoVT family DNA-binding domain-containing protein [Polymorphobacter sp.]